MPAYTLNADTREAVSEQLETPLITPAAQAAILAVPPRPAPQRTVRYKLWELQDCWYCSIIGTCLTVAEVRQAAKKAGVKHEPMTDYEVHRLAVESAAERRHPLTQRVQRLLDSKSDVQIRLFRRAEGAEQLQNMWCEQSQAGNVGAGLWALITHPRVTSDLVHRVYGDIHMMSHLAGARTCMDTGRLASQQRRIDELEASLRTERRRSAQRRQSLVDELQNLREQLTLARRQCQALPDRDREPGIQLQPVHSANKRDRAVQILSALRKDYAHLRERLKASATREQHLLEDHARLEQILAGVLHREEAPSPDTLKLCGRCVLYLGGKARHCRHFQALVEAHRGRFLHHDGGREDSGQRIAELVGQADVVLCPTDCISHSAMKKARMLCDRQDKQMIYLQRASLSAFVSSLEQVARRS